MLLSPGLRYALRFFPCHSHPYTTVAPPLRGKRVLVTGGSRGIGLGISQAFAAAGASVVRISRSKDQLAAVQETLIGGPHAVIAGDVGDFDFWESVRRQEKNIDILVNAAGVTHYSLLMATTRETIDEVVGTNLMGCIFGCKAILRGMLRQKGGCIINISSVMAIKGGEGSAAYAASKAGVLGLTRALAAEVGPSGIRVNAIIPGYITTDMTEKMTAGAMSNALSTTPLHRLGTIDEVASAALFLATNSFTNGTQLVIDGGLSSV